MANTQKDKDGLISKEQIEQTSDQQSPLNNKYRFENLIVSASNQMAYSVAKSICDNEEVKYNPFIIVGDSCLGKSHLVQSIGNLLLNNKIVVAVSAEQFLNDFTNHIINSMMNSFREKYRKCDILIIEDIQYLANKEGIQEELFFTMEDLLANNKQIILTSSMHPNQIYSLNERLLGRFVSGLIVEIKPYDMATKIEIIKMKAKIHTVKLTSDVVDYIAKSVDSNIYEMEGMILKIMAYSQLMHTEVDLKSVKKLLLNE